MKIRWIEDVLIDVAQDFYGIELVPEAYTASTIVDDTHVLAICDGANSETRAGLADKFGTPSRELYSIAGTPLDETVLGIQVKSSLPDEFTVPLTVSQNRFLFNSLGDGFINMRLTADEAEELVGVSESGPADCMLYHGCAMQREGGILACRKHGAVFKPSVDRLSHLWPRIQDGLRFFGVTPADILGINAFKLGMQHTVRFTAQLTPKTFGFLLGDAANSLHFWPGRGLNTGLKSALSLAANITVNWRGKPFFAADFSTHEGVMQALQYREKSRAWSAMLMSDENGHPRGIAHRIHDGLKGPFDRPALTAELLGRMRSIKGRLVNRMGRLPDDEWYLTRINALDVKTLKVLVESGEWITRETGGQEISIHHLSRIASLS